MVSGQSLQRGRKEWMKKVLSTFLVLYILWIALAGFSTEELLVGAIVSLIVAYLIKSTSVYDFGAKFIVQAFKFIFMYLPLFIFKLIQANISLAKIVLDPKLPINPGFVTISTGLTGDVSKLILANSITLTPGTLTVDVNEDELLIHWVDVEGKDENDYFKHIASSFEKTLGGIVE